MSIHSHKPYHHEAQTLRLFLYYPKYHMSDTDLVAVEHEGVLVVDSRLVASELGLNHSTWMTNVIKKYQPLLEANFGHLHFENGTVINSVGAVNKVVFVWLTEDQATFLMTLSRNTDACLKAKVKLVKAFSEAKARLSATTDATIALAELPYPLVPPTPQEISEVIDLTLGKTSIDPKRSCELKLNAIALYHPAWTSIASEALSILDEVPTQSQFLTPTQLGKLHFNMSAIAINKLLIERGFQTRSFAKGGPDYLPTEKGKKYTTIISNQSSKKQCLWLKSILDVLEAKEAVECT